VTPGDEAGDTLYTHLDDFLCEALPASPLRSLLRTLIQRERARQRVAPAVARLPLLTCALVGGSPAAALPAALAWNLLQLAAQLLDCLEDGASLHELAPSLQPPQALNAATTLLCLAFRTLDPSPHSAADPLGRVRRRLNEAVLAACLGQHRDLSVTANADCTLDEYREIIGAKSGRPFAWAAAAGALLGGAPAPQVAAGHDFGYNLGVLIQLADDWADLWAPDGRSDLAQGRCTLPASYALAVAPAGEGQQLARWLAAAPRCLAAEVKARQAIIRLGAPHYLLVEAGRCRRRALEALSTLGSGVQPSDPSTEPGTGSAQGRRSEPCVATPVWDELVALLNLVGPCSDMESVL
jgi:geranylgeranyl pyrophosphate synthase